MSKDKQTTDASKTELTDEQLEGAQGGTLDHKMEIHVLSSGIASKDSKEGSLSEDTVRKTTRTLKR